MGSPPVSVNAEQRERMRQLWAQTAPLMDKWLSVKAPEVPDASLLKCDWQTVLPYLDWNEKGILSYDLDVEGRLCFPIKMGVELPPDVEEHTTTTTVIARGERIVHRLLPLDAPPLRDYQRVQSYHSQRQIYEMAKAANEVHDSIADPETDEPIPRSILRQNPALAAWLNGENPNYAPTLSEYKVLWPAFIERRRRLREGSLTNETERLGGEDDSGSVNAIDLILAAEPLQQTTESKPNSKPGPKADDESDAASKPRGRKKADYETVQREAELAANWVRSRDSGVYKADFTKEQRMQVKDFDRLLDRVAKRKNSSE